MKLAGRGGRVDSLLIEVQIDAASLQGLDGAEQVDERPLGDLIGSGEAQERGIVGETPNLAARLQGVAEPNTVVIAEDTRRLLGNLFELEDLGAKELKGIAGPARAWTALRPSSVEGRFEALHGTLQESGMDVEHEVPGEGISTLDFGFTSKGQPWKIELMRLLETKAAKAATKKRPSG